MGIKAHPQRKLDEADFMEMTTVESNLLKAIGYDEASRELHIHFARGGEYVYHDVPKDAHEQLMAAESKGKHFLAHIKPAYQFKKK